MIIVKGYNAVDYETFQGVLFDAYKRSKKTFFKLAGEIEASSTQTAANAFRKDQQLVSDKTLTLIMDCVGLNGFILSVVGKKFYYIKNGK